MEPVSFGLLHSDTQWVFDEMHLLGPALATSRRLQQLRDQLGTAAPTRSLWMSSTWEPTGSASVVELGEADRQGPLALRLKAVRRIRELVVDPGHYVRDLAQALAEAHVPGTQSIAVLNTEERAREFARAVRKTAPERDVLLIHSRFRSADQRRLRLELTDGAAQSDRIVVTTSAVEAGLDLSSRTLLTELAPWPSIVQRAGRCNRDGEHPNGGDLLWCPSPEGGAAAQWLTSHEGQPVTAAQLQDARVGEDDPAIETLSQNHLAELFDMATDQVDVSSWICAPTDHTVLVAWRSWEFGEPADEESDPGRDELCQVPLAEVRPLLDGRGWVRDGQERRWRSAAAEDVRPGTILLLDARLGGYLPDEGWAPESRTPVEPCEDPGGPRTFACTAWVSLDQHLMESEEEARVLLDALPDLAPDQHDAVARAARYHDLGKCHEVFQQMLRGGGGDPPNGLLAKSKAPYSTGTYSRPHFRHELVSALILLQETQLPGDHGLVTYLAAAHHGHVRITVRPHGTEAPRLLGVQDGDRTPPVDLSTGEHFPAQTLSTAVFESGAASSWTDRALALRDRPDLGPFRLAYLETLVRIADWRSSARHDGPVAGLG